MIEISERIAQAIERKANDEERQLKQLSGFTLQYDSNDLSYDRVRALREAAEVARDEGKRAND